MNKKNPWRSKKVIELLKIQEKPASCQSNLKVAESLCKKSFFLSALYHVFPLEEMDRACAYTVITE